MGVAEVFKVSTDYILGLSTVSVRKSYDISELDLSEGAVRGLVTDAVDVQVLNRLLEHRAEAKHFKGICKGTLEVALAKYKFNTNNQEEVLL